MSKFRRSTRSCRFVMTIRSACKSKSFPSSTSWQSGACSTSTHTARARRVSLAVTPTSRNYATSSLCSCRTAFPSKFVSEHRRAVSRKCLTRTAEIPLYHVLTAKVTFGNIHGIDKSVEGVSTIKESAGSFCAVDENIFAVPAGYRRQGL